MVIRSGEGFLRRLDVPIRDIGVHLRMPCMVNSITFRPADEDPDQVPCEQREEPLLKKYKDPSILRPSAIHGGLAKCFKKLVNEA